MITLPCTVRDYDPATATCTVELTGIGAFDSWIAGVVVDAAIPAGSLTYGTPGVLSLPDTSRVCEARLTSVYPSGVTLTRGGNGTVTTQTGRAAFTLDANGSGVTAVTFPVAFDATPTVTVAVDRAPSAVPSITALSASGFTAGYGNPALAYETLYFTWVAQGT